MNFKSQQDNVFIRLTAALSAWPFLETLVIHPSLFTEQCNSQTGAIKLNYIVRGGPPQVSPFLGNLTPFYDELCLGETHFFHTEMEQHDQFYLKITY